MAKNKKLWGSINRVLLVALIFLMLFMRFFPIDVIDDSSWRLVVAGGTTHYADDILSVSSIYRKLRNVTGDATRYLECKNQSGVFVRYPVNMATADRKPGDQGTGFFMGIPKEIPLPARCRASITILYPVVPVIKVVTEHVESEEFDVLPESQRPVGETPSAAGSEVNQSTAPSSPRSSTQTTDNVYTSTTENTVIKRESLLEETVDAVKNLPLIRLVL